MATRRFFIKQPKKSETLAGKQEERRRRLNHLRGRLSEFPAQWWVGVGEILGVMVLFLTNLWLLYPFFGIPDQVNVFSAPLIPVLANITEKFVPFSYGVRIWLLVFLVSFPLSFYYFVKEISGRKLAAFLASFLVILPVGIFLKVRVELGILGEDGAHIASLTFVPLVCLLLLRFLKRGNFWAGIFSALGTALVALTSPIGFFVLAVFMTIVAFSEMLLGRGRLKLVRFLVIIALAAGFSAFWYNPKFIFLTIASPQGQVIKKTLSNLLPLSFFLLPLLGVFGYLLFENQLQLQSLFIAFFLTIAFGLFSLGAGVAHPSSSRFLPAFGMSFAFLLGILITWFFDFLRLSEKLEKFKLGVFKRKLIAFGLIGFIFSLTVLIIIFFGKNLWELEQIGVLGAVSSEQTVGLWEIRQKTEGVTKFFGYGITGLTFLFISLLGRSLKR